MRLVAIDVAPGEVRIARAERTLAGFRVTALERRPLGDLAGVAGSRLDAVLSAIAPHRIAHRVLVLPFRDRRRIGRAAPLELLGQLPLDADGVKIACAPLGPAPGGTAVLAAAVREDDLAAHRAALARAGVAPTAIDLSPLPLWNLVSPGADDVALVLADDARSALTIRRGGRIAGLRALDALPREPAAFAAEVRWSLAALGGVPATLVLAGADASDTLASALATATGARVVALDDVAVAAVRGRAQLGACALAAGLVAGVARRDRAGVFLAGTSAGEPGSLRRVAALALVAVAFAATDAALLHAHLARRDAALVRAIAAEASAALPGTRLVAPAAQVTAAAAAAARRDPRLGGRASVLDVVRDVSARVPASVRLDLDELTVDADGLVLHGRAEGFEAIDALRRALAASPGLADVAAEETRTTVDGRRVEFRLRAARRAAGGAIS
jgi:hypothetical protein